MTKNNGSKFRKIISKNGLSILAGKDAESNEALIKQVGPEEEVFHTLMPGSPFVNIKGYAKRGDTKEAAIFCARYSKDWKRNKRDVIIHRFIGKEIYKEKGMKNGTFGVRKFKIIKVKKGDIEKWGK